MAALIVGSLLAVLGLAYVLTPLMRVSATGAVLPHTPHAPLLPNDASALEALREIEFDQATGKLSPDDYASLKATYAPRALAELKAREAAGVVAPAHDSEAASTSLAAAAGVATDDLAEQLVARMRSRATTCPEHGARPESDAVFCSDCGRFLSASCLRCGASIEEAHARFCGECGASLAA